MSELPFRDKLMDSNGFMSAIWLRFLRFFISDTQKRVKKLEERVSALES
jgi:hypothetical protein